MWVEIKGIWVIRREFTGKKNKIKTEKKRLMEKIAKDAIEVRVIITPKKSWMLRKWYKYKATSWKAEVWNEKGYYKFIDEGTKRHFVKPKKGKVIKFSKNGKNVYSRWHAVKGIRAHNITDKTIETVTGRRLKLNLEEFLESINEIH